MNKSNNKIIKSYVKEVTKELKCSKMLTLVFRKRFMDEIYSFAEGQENISYEFLSERFGTPKKVADSFLERADYEELLKLSKKREVFWRCAAIIGFVALVIVIIFFAICMHEAAGTIIVSDANIK